jgi:hypothetical protein
MFCAGDTAVHLHQNIECGVQYQHNTHSVLLSGIISVTEQEDTVTGKGDYCDKAKHKQYDLPYRANLAKVIRHLPSPPSILKESV